METPVSLRTAPIWKTTTIERRMTDAVPKPQIPATPSEKFPDSDNVEAQVEDPRRRWSKKRNASVQLQDQTERMSFKHTMLVFSLLMFSIFIALADRGATIPAVPTIANAFAAQKTISWLGTGALIANGTFSPLFGRLSDIFGRKETMCTAIILMSADDLVCSFMPSAIGVYVSNAMVGIGRGGIQSLVYIIVADLISLRKRGKYISAITVASAFGNIVGPIYGGALAQSIGWRWVFRIEPPIGLILALVIWFTMPTKPVEGVWQKKLGQIDFVGFVLLVSGLLCSMVAISLGGTLVPWKDAKVIGLLTGGITLLVILVIWEYRFAKLPAIPLRLFTDRHVGFLLLNAAFVGLPWYAAGYYLQFYCQEIRGYDPLLSGVITMPLVVLQAVGTVIAGWVQNTWGRYKWLLFAGNAVYAIGFGLLTLTTEITPPGLFVFYMCVMGAGAGFCLQTALIGVQANCDPKDRAVATAVRFMMQNAFGGIGVAICGTIIINELQSVLPDTLPPEVRKEILNGNRKIANNLSPLEMAVARRAFMEAMNPIFILFVPFAVVATVLVVFCKDTKLELEEGEVAKRKPSWFQRKPSEALSQRSFSTSSKSSAKAKSSGSVAMSSFNGTGEIFGHEPVGEITSECAFCAPTDSLKVARRQSSIQFFGA